MIKLKRARVLARLAKALDRRFLSPGDHRATRWVQAWANLDKALFWRWPDYSA